MCKLANQTNCKLILKQYFKFQQELALRQAGVHPVVAALYAQQILNNGDSKSVEAKQQELLLHALLAQQNDPKQQQMLLQSLLTQQNLVQQQAILQAILSQAEPKVYTTSNAFHFLFKLGVYIYIYPRVSYLIL